MSSRPGDGDWLQLQPPEGWASYTRHTLLLDAIWAGLSETGGDWRYLNSTSRLSIWEARDGSALQMALADDEHLEELAVQTGAAADYLLPIAQQFGLVAV